MRLSHPAWPTAFLVALFLSPALTAAEVPASFLAPHFPAREPGATALLKRDGKVLMKEARGMASLELDVPLKADQVFRVGSITKTFVAAMVLQLVDEGKLALDAPLSTYLPEAPKAWEKVTVAHLLSHTSGISDYLGGPHGGYSAIRARRLSLDQLIAHFASWPLEFQPGAQFRYSNSGYVLLGKLIRVATGRDFPAELAARITGPLGLTHTQGGDPDALIPGLATGYTDGSHPAYLARLDGAYTDGCLTSTAADLAAFAEALHGGRLLKPATYLRMITPFTFMDGSFSEYGFGLFIRRSHGHTLVGHGGDIFGFHGMLETDLDTRAVAVLLHNGDQFGPHRSVAADYLTRRMLARAAGTPIPEPRAMSLAPEALAQLCGTYEGSSGRRVIRLEQGQLVSQVNGGRPIRIQPATPSTCFAPGGELRLRFTFDQGRAVAVQAYEDAGEAGSTARRVDPS